MPVSPLQIGFPLFRGFTQLDLSGPWEVLTRLPDTNCHLLAHDNAPVRSADGMSILPTLTYTACPQLDVLCVPGGAGSLDAMEDQVLLAFLRRQATSCRYVTSVCTGSMILAAAGLLTGYRATTHWLSLPRLAAFGVTPVKQRVVIDRNRVTGGGVTAGIDFGLVLAAHLAGEAVAREIQVQIEYAPAPPYEGDPDLAKPETVTAIRTRLIGSGCLKPMRASLRASAVSKTACSPRDRSAASVRSRAPRAPSPAPRWPGRPGARP